MKQSIKEAGYKHIWYNPQTKEHTLYNTETKQLEAWTASKGYAGYTLAYKNTELEFCHSFNIPHCNTAMRCGLSQE